MSHFFDLNLQACEDQTLFPERLLEPPQFNPHMFGKPEPLVRDDEARPRRSEYLNHHVKRHTLGVKTEEARRIVKQARNAWIERQRAEALEIRRVTRIRAIIGNDLVNFIPVGRLHTTWTGTLRLFIHTKREYFVQAGFTNPKVIYIPHNGNPDHSLTELKYKIYKIEVLEHCYKVTVLNFKDPDVMVALSIAFWVRTRFTSTPEEVYRLLWRYDESKPLNKREKRLLPLLSMMNLINPNG